MKFEVAGASIGCVRSLPARGVWIEIYGSCDLSETKIVTPRKGSVD